MPAEQRTPTVTTIAGSEKDMGTARKGYSPRHSKVRSLQRSLFLASKANRRRVFYQLYQHVCRADVLEYAWQQVRRNGGAGGVDHISIEDFSKKDKHELLVLENELKQGTYRPSAIRRVFIPKNGIETRPLGIPTIRDRIVQAAVKIVLEPVLEARFYEHSYGFRPQRSAHQALARVERLMNGGYPHVLDLDIRQFFDSVPHAKLLTTTKRHCCDGKLLGLLKRIMTAPVQEPHGSLRRSTRGCPQGGPLSPLLANLYLHGLDTWFLKHTRYKQMVWVRYADDGVLLSRTPIRGIRNRIEGVLGAMGLSIHPDKTHIIDMSQLGSTIDFLGYRYARRRSQSATSYALLRYPSPKAMASIRAKVRAIVPTRGNVDANILVQRVNRVLIGWVRYFGRSGRKQPFRTLGWFIFKRIRTYLRRRSKQRRRGTRRYPEQWLREKLGLLSAYILWVEHHKQLKEQERK